MIFDWPTLETLLVTFIITAVRTILEASPTLFGGVVVAAWLRTQATPEKIKTIFCGEGIQGSLRTVLVGMALPVCSIGVLPVLRELRQLGLSTGKLITLGIAAPLLNPFSLLFGISVLSFPQYLIMIAATFFLAIVLGEVSFRFAVGDPVSALARPAGLTGGTRMRNMLIAASRLMTGRTLLDLIVTIIISALTLSLIRYGAFHLLCESSNRGGPALASLLTLTQYVSPSRAIIQFAGIDDANYATATGLAIYLLGTGVAGASIVTFFQWYGWRRMLAVAIPLLLCVASVTYFLSFTLPAPVGETAETAALDNLSRPAYSSLAYIDRTFKESLVFLNTFMIVSSVAVVALILVGLYVRLAKVEFRDDDPEVAAELNARRMSKAVSGSQLGAVAVGLMGIFFCVSTYMFFPGPTELMQVMERVQLDAGIEVQSRNADAAVDRIVAWDSAAANISIGAAIRGSFPTPLQRRLTRELRTELRAVRALIDDGDFVSAKTKLSDLKQLLSKTKEAFAGRIHDQPAS